MNKKIAKNMADLGFSAEALEKLQHYAGMIATWNKAINLVAPSTLNDLWERHLLDSAQLWPIIAALPDQRIIDLGSGGGLPGLVVAMAGAAEVTMVESDARKCVFLREVSRETKLSNVQIVNERIEKPKTITAPIITARALAPLKQLILWSTPLLSENGTMVFLKGADVEREMEDLSPEIVNKITLKPSITDKNARIVVIRF